MEHLTMGDCCYIFRNISKEGLSYEEKMYAIKRVLNMETKNHITKVDMLDVILWLVTRLEEKK